MNGATAILQTGVTGRGQNAFLASWVTQTGTDRILFFFVNISTRVEKKKKKGQHLRKYVYIYTRMKSCRRRGLPDSYL